jgi:flotillin
MIGAFAALLLIGGIAAVLIVATIQNIIYICQPNEVLIFSGHRDGKRGYRIIKGGRATRVPLFETVDRLDLTNMQIEVAVEGAYSKGGIPLNVMGVANVKIAGESPALDNAIQRFLGRPRDRIMRVAKETLEGNLRGVLATLTPEEVNGAKEKFSRELQKEAEEGLHKLGLTLDTLKIQNVSDDSGYLNSIGRRQTAEIVKSARISEAQNKAQSLIQAANNKQESELSKLQAELDVARAESERRVRNAESMQQALIAEQQGQVQALVARARGELMLQDARAQQVRSKLEAEVIQPARAQSDADLAKARGEAAKIVENGKATATALSELARQWKKMGSSARDIFLLQKLDVILPIYLSSIKQVKVDKLTMLPPGAQGTPGQLVGSLETLRAGGIDLARAFRRWTGADIEGLPVVEEAPVEVAAAPESAPAQAAHVAPVPPPLFGPGSALEPSPRAQVPVAKKVPKNR